MSVASPLRLRRGWLSILQASYIIYLLKPFYRNRGKRLVKSQKLYFYDTGLLCYLLGIESSVRFISAMERGHLFENFVVIEAVKQLSFQSKRGELFFYRTSNQLEIDLIVESAGKLVPYEIKYAQGIKRKMAEPIMRFLQEYEQEEGYVVSLFADTVALTKKVKALHWSRCF